MASPFIELDVGERAVKLTNPDKVLFPKARRTKRDLAEYYVAVGEGIVRALYERPTQLRRFPDGMLVEERELIAIEALLRVGRREMADARAMRFRDAHPSSVHLPRLDRLLAGAAR